jgi:ribosomal protein L37AE/L43A
MFTITVAQNSTTKTFTRGRERDAVLVARKKFEQTPEATITVTSETGEIIWKTFEDLLGPLPVVTEPVEQIAKAEPVVTWAPAENGTCGSCGAQNVVVATDTWLCAVCADDTEAPAETPAVAEDFGAVTQEQAAALSERAPVAEEEPAAPVVKTAAKFKITDSNLMVIKPFQLVGLPFDDAFLDVSASANTVDPRLMQIEITSSNSPLPVATPGAVLRSNGGYWRPVVFENADGTGAIRSIGARQNNRTLAVLAVIDLWDATFSR